MGWIKRNLFFAIGGVVALGLLGAGAFYIYKDWTRNSAAAGKLNEIYATLKNLQTQKPAPGNDKINNTEIAKQQQKEMQAWIATTELYFRAVPAIPPGSVTSEAYASALRRTIDTLQREAEAASVTLPAKYDFSFSAQRPLVRFAAGSLQALARQLGEVKAISETLFSTRINALDSIQRIRVSEDDLAGPPGDYTDAQAVTNELAVLTPYVVTFRSFTPELARVLSAFATSSNAFLIKAINVLPASATPATGYPGEGGMGMPGGYSPPGAYAPPRPYAPGAVPNRYGSERYGADRYGGEMGGMPGITPVPQQPVATGRGGLQTVLKEQLLRITMEVEIIKLLPKS